MNRDIFETIYFHSLKTSCELASKEGAYETYVGSPVSKVRHIFKDRGLFPSLRTGAASTNVDVPLPDALAFVLQGILQPDMWGVTPTDRWDWPGLRADIGEKGVRNSLLVAPMPTASTSQILGNNECFEPYTSNIYSRRVLR